MKVKALKSFIGKLSMNVGEEKEILDEKLAQDLLKTGHIIEIKAEKEEAKVEAKKDKKDKKETTTK